MDPNDTTTSVEHTLNGNGELSHSDKMIGVFSEPAKMFAHTSKFPPRNKDWVIPVLIFFIVVALISTHCDEVYDYTTYGTTPVLVFAYQ